ncbi:MAG: regulatory protein RecX [Bdellovibrio sp.]|nr:regulatory protein RecX [Bdellovibrio sp.]
MDLLAIRDHSEQELRLKLTEKFSENEEVTSLVEEAIAIVKDKKWLSDPMTLAQRWADTLHKRNKGIEYINSYLREKGLPEVPADHDVELEKALSVIRAKYTEDYNFSREEKAKVGRQLASRGFDSETVRKVLYEKL